ncbi:MAG: O-antigen ligase family protein [Candidatus Hydrogenedentes bacterium]|nr:O-antigen ligase family protein [Candidatus Hydrogenedentota bacterium]
MSMAAMPRTEAATSTNAMTVGLVIALGIVLSIAVVVAGSWAIAGIIGLYLFLVFLREPVRGLYLTTILLLVSGIAIPLGGTLVTMPGAAARLCGIAALAAWVLHTFTARKQLRLGWDTWAVLAFAAWSLVSIGYSLLWRIQLPEWTRMLNLIAYFIFAIHVLDTKEKLHNYVIIIVSCAAAMSLYAIMQYLLPIYQFVGVAGIEGIGSGADLAFVDPEGTSSSAAVRVTGGTGHSNWLAFTLLLVMPLNIYWYATRQSRGAKAFVIAITLVQLAALVLTFTRLGLIVGLLIVLVLLAKRSVRLTPHRVAGLAVALLIAWFALPAAYKERVIDFTKYSRSESTAARVELQQFAWKYMQEYPMLGIGIAGFGPRFYEENTDTAQMLRWMVRYLGWNPIYYGPHNFYLQVGAEAGTIGLLIMLFFVVRALLNTQRAERIFREEGSARFALLAGTLTVSVLSFVFCGLFLHALQQKIWWMIFAAAAALPYIAARTAEDTETYDGVNPKYD